ncbi:cobyric acid synthase [Dongshaea marina]|uniref:cobyric acid synthase n=1 Tax=Dongshaea marina TaxID=2047966 RepID=UPI0018FF9D5F|nr:cobyric acid synthase [Dongshaea marina]
MAKLADAPVLLVADIDRGGVFASIYGTLALLEPGLRQIEALTSVPVLGVIPWMELALDDEDGVALQSRKSAAYPHKLLDIAVIQLPHISNFTDFNPLEVQPDVRLRYVSHRDALGEPDLLILPGSKNTLGDLSYLYECGLAEEILACHGRGTPIFGICGGFQMLGRHIIDGVESSVSRMDGLGLLDCETRFASEKTTTRVIGTLSPQLTGLFSGCRELAVMGYEIHMGQTRCGPAAQAFSYLERGNGQAIEECEGAINPQGTVAGTYLHGVFDNDLMTRALLNGLRQRRGMEPLDKEGFCYQEFRQQQFDQLADCMRQHLNIPKIYQLMREYQKPS